MMNEKGYPEIDFGLLKELGINTYPEYHEFIFMYPPLDTLPEIENSEAIFQTDKISNPLCCLYFHIPFCSDICNYCWYVRYKPKNENILSQYLDALAKETKMISKKISKCEISSVYIGGGTPTLLSEKQLIDLLNMIKKTFDVKKNIEICIESNPETVSTKKIELLKEYGINRISIGVQTFDDNLLTKLNKRYTSAQALKAINLLKDSIENFNVDFMYGLPGQDVGDLENIFNKVENIKPSSVTFYQLSFNFHNHLISKDSPIRYPDDKNLTNKETILLMKRFINERMAHLNYIPISTYQFVREERFISQSLLSKWNNIFLVGMGVATRSYYNGSVYQNIAELNEYLNTLKKNKLPIMKGKRLSYKEKVLRTIILGLKLVKGVNIKIVEQNYGLKVREVLGETGKNLENAEMIKYEGNYLKLTKQGILFADEILKLISSMKIL